MEQPGETSETQSSEASSNTETLFILPAPERQSNRAFKPLWRDLILKTWGEDPLRCPCCRGTMKNAGMLLRRSEIEFFLRLHGLWEGIIALPPPPDPPFNIETMEPIDIPLTWSWSDQIGPPPPEWWMEGDPAWTAPELPLDGENTLVLDADNSMTYHELPVFLIE